MPKRPTIADLATAAGVSVATVDRVLNKRHRVREDTAHRVLDSARLIGFYATGLIERRLAENLPRHTLTFLLQKGGQHFYQRLGEELAVATRESRARKRAGAAAPRPGTAGHLHHP